MKPDEQALAARKRQRNLLAAVGVSALLVLSFATFESYRDLQVGRSQEDELRTQIEASEERIESLELRVRRLREDPAMIERLAREELLMARPGELVILLPSGVEGTTPSDPAPASPTATGEPDAAILQKTNGGAGERPIGG